MRRKSSVAGAGIGVLILTLVASVGLPFASSVASAATAHVSLTPAAGTGVHPAGLRHRHPRLQLRGQR